MDTLQIQDTFEPYFAERKSERSSAPSHAKADGAGTRATAADMRARLSACRDRLAAAIERRSVRH